MKITFFVTAIGRSAVGRPSETKKTKTKNRRPSEKKKIGKKYLPKNRLNQIHHQETLIKKIELKLIEELKKLGFFNIEKTQGLPTNKNNNNLFSDKTIKIVYSYKNINKSAKTNKTHNNKAGSNCEAGPDTQGKANPAKIRYG